MGNVYRQLGTYLGADPGYCVSGDEGRGQVSLL